ncbi:ferric reductase NAD binding domain-containing protein [Xylariaceae sp. FL0255]|nr:ferric reductase NAD binding domain-containing protein [Xylariaceae sp. FL0255]
MVAPNPGASTQSPGAHPWSSPAAIAREKLNAQILTYYAISLSGIIGLFILGHWMRYLTARLPWTKTRFVILYPIVGLTRSTRRTCLRRLLGFTSIGHAVVVAVFVALNAFFSFYKIDRSNYSEVAARFGWMASGNMALVVFLALKNTPLAILTAYSYERLNVLHQIAGYTTFLYTALHGSIYTWYFIHAGKVEVLQQKTITAGIVLGFAVLSTTMSGLILQRLNYELFYVVHLMMAVIIIITLGLHRPTFEPDKTLIITVIIGALWFSDRLLRFCRLAYNGINNKAVVYPLPHGGTRIVLQKPLHRARPGKHCFVWLPGVRAFETHPFTIVASEPMELVINSYSGFTRDLHRYATNNPGGRLAVSLEGPYGTFPDPMDYDKVILLAGGSGATFTMGVAANMIQRMKQDSNKQIEFIWATQAHDNIAWFRQHLNKLINHEHASKIAMRIHLTRAIPQSNTSLASATSLPSPPPLNRTLSQAVTERAPTPPMDLDAVVTPQTSSTTLRDNDAEKAGAVHQEVVAPAKEVPIINGRPDVAAMIRTAIASVPRNERVLVAACGPTGLMNTVRNTTAACISVDGPAVELHCEQFGW